MQSWGMTWEADVDVCHIVDYPAGLIHYSVLAIKMDAQY